MISWLHKTRKKLSKKILCKRHSELKKTMTIRVVTCGQKFNHTVFKISTDLFQVRHGSLSLQTNTRKNKQTRKCKQTVPNVISYKKRRTKKNPGKNIPGKFQKIPKNSRKL